MGTALLQLAQLAAPQFVRMLRQTGAGAGTSAARTHCQHLHGAAGQSMIAVQLVGLERLELNGLKGVV